MNCGDAALSYATQGWLVLPLNGKAPLTELVPHAVKDATTDADTITRWWGERPDANVGITCGFGLMVLDVDGAEGRRTLGLLDSEHGDFPETRWVRTGREDGGLHIYFAGRGRGHKIGPGLDLRGEGSYVAAPPSVHPDTGRRYEVVDDHELAPLPDSLRKPEPKPKPKPLPVDDELTLKRLRAAADAAVDGELEELARHSTEPKTMRGTALFAAACALGRHVASGGLPRGYAESQLRQVGDRLQLDETERERSIERGLAEGEQEPYVLSERDQSGPDSGQASSAQGDRHNNHNVTTEAPNGDVVTVVTPPYDGIKTGDALMRESFPELAWHLPNVIPEGLTLIVGSPKIGKSWLTHALALAVACGGALFTERLDARPVLHLALEDSDRRLQARTRVLGVDADELANWHYITRLPPGRRAHDVIIAWIERLPDDALPPLVIVDTLGRVKGPRARDESPYDHDYRIGVELKQIADSVPGMSMSAVHHDRKAQSADFVEDVSGTNGLGGSADTIVVVRRERTQPDGVMLITGRDVDEAAYGVTFKRGLWALTGESWEEARESGVEAHATLGRGDLAGRVIAHIVEKGDAAPAELALALGENRDAVRQSLQRMYDSGVLIRVKRGRYALPQPGGDS